MIYFGCHERPGHFFLKPAGSLTKREEDALPWSAGICDGNLQPGTAEMKRSHAWQRPEKQEQGVCRIHHKDGWTAMAFWDRSCDHRRNSCSVIMAMALGELTFDDMIIGFRESFPKIYARVTASFALVEEPER